jgi:hypothetical protein
VQESTAVFSTIHRSRFTFAPPRDFLWWLIALVLMAVGLIGTVLPLVPGAIIILAAAILHQVMLAPRRKSRLLEHRRTGRAGLVFPMLGIREWIFRREMICRHEMETVRLAAIRTLVDLF